MPGKIEKPSYVVIRKLENDAEIREYSDQIWAKSPLGEENRSFGILAEYIFGGNDRQEKIGMTAPVVTSRNEMSFIMPARYNLENLPRPLNSQILKNHDIETEGEPFLMRYNPSWTLPPLRRNEVAIKVKL